MPDTDLLMVPGLLCTEALFGPQIGALRSDVKVTVADHRRADSMAAIAAQVLADAPDRFALCGLSMGGYIALEILRQQPARVTRLALLDASATPETPKARDRRLSMMAYVAEGRFMDVAETFWPLFVHASRLNEADLKARVKAMVSATGPDAYLRQQTAILTREDYRPTLPAVACPALVLCGEQDRLTPVAESQILADGIAGSKLVVLPDCGHLSTLEKPEAVTAALRQWLTA